MSRYNSTRDSGPVLDAAARWIRTCLIDEGSLFGDSALWRQEVMHEVKRAFTDNPDEGGDDFYEKLNGQLSKCSSEAKCLMAELLWVLMLFQSNIKPVTKRKDVARVWELSGRRLDLTHPLLADSCLEGIGNPGIAYNTMRWRELNYIIGLSIHLESIPREQREIILTFRNDFERWIEAAPQEGYRQFRHIFRYFAFPDQNERITQNRDRREILEAFTKLDPKLIHDMSDSQQDDELLIVRKQLEVELGTSEIDFYDPPLVDKWRVREPKEKKKKASSEFDLGYAELRSQFVRMYPNFKSFTTNNDYISDERAYKDELLYLFDKEVQPLLSQANWTAAGNAAIELLWKPLQHAGNKPQNIVGWRYVDLLRQLDSDKRSAFAQHLNDLFDEQKPIDVRVDLFVEQLQELSKEGKKVIPAALRSITGFYLALSKPDRHIFMKTDEMQRALRKLQPSFQWKSGNLKGTEVKEVEALANKVFDQLVAENWSPKDLLDVQGFLWAAITYQSKISETNKSDEEETQMKPETKRTAPLNQILFGPPGTGKTFATINKSLEILDPIFLADHATPEDRSLLKGRFDELVDAKRIRFVTFHQSFSYEDFVEGLRADIGQDGQLRYKVESGVFKNICDDARGTTQIAASVGISPDARIWKISIDGTGPSPTREYCFDHNEARVGWGLVGDLRDEYRIDNPNYQRLGSQDRNTLQAFSNEMLPGDIVLCIASTKEIQAIGVVTGDYRFEANVPAGIKKDYCNVLPVSWLATNLKLNINSLNAGIGLTLKTVYEITRFGWPELAREVEAAGIPLKGTSSLTLQNGLDHVLIIDEINRGNVSRIFGELITLIEKSKREGSSEQLKVELPYSRTPFTIPDNVYLIGTMNTADRSLAGLDIALRRRFQFVEMPPQPELLAEVTIAGINIAAILEVMNKRIESLLDRDHQLGHAYFMTLSNNSSLSDLASIFRYQILPLLQEYFFENWERIAWVLNDHRKAAGFQFVVQSNQNSENLFGRDIDMPDEAKLWRIDSEAFGKVQSYLGIVEAEQG